MANPIYPIPRPGSPISETGSVATREWYNYWQNLSSDSGGPSTAELENDITIISEKLGSPDGTPENIPPQSDGGKVIGVNSIASIGALPGVVTLTLQGDSAAPGNTYYYGTNGTGAKGFYTVSSTILGAAGNIALTTGSDGVTTINLAAVTQGTTGTLRAITLDGFGRVVQNKAATITGTANRVTVTNGDASAGLPTIDIASTYVGQTSITTLGTVTTGTWNATLIGPTFGGTGQNTVASGDILYGSAANVWSRRAIGSTNQVLIVSGGLPTWGQVSLTAGVTGTLPATNGGTGQATYTIGDILYASSTTALSKLPIGSAGQILKVSGGLPSWAADSVGTVTSIDVSGGTTGLTTSGGPVTSSGTITLAGTLNIANGGTGQTTANAAFNALSPMTADGDLIYRSGGVAIRLPIGSNGQVLGISGGLPVWQSAGGSGTVTSVGITPPAAGITVSNSPITSSGNMTLALANDLAALEGIGGTGIAVRTAADTWTTRTTLAGTGISISNADGVAGNITVTNTGVTSFNSRTGTVIPTSGDYSFSLISGTAAATQGGTGQTTYTLGDIIYSSASNTLAKLAGNTTTAKQYLSQTGTGTVSAAPVWSTITGADITGAALTKTDDTNVTLTLGGTPATALLRAASITVGWTGTLSIARGGTGQATASAAFDALAPTTTSQDLIVRGASSNGRLGVGANGNVLTVTGGVVGWAAPATNGTVTSVALSLPSFITVTGSPVTTSGTLTGTLATQTANTVFAGPSSGSAAAPTFRALVSADVPLPTDYISGLKLIWNSATSISVGTGEAIIPSTGKTEVVASTLTLSSLSLSASTVYNVYLFDNAGTPTIECVTTAPASPYQGTARAKTGDTTRRWLGSVLTDSSGNVYNFAQTGNSIRFIVNISLSPFRFVSNGTSSSRVSTSLASVIPASATQISLRVQNTATTGSLVIDIPESGFTGATGINAVGPLVGAYFDIPVPSRTVIYIYNVAPSGGGAFLDISGYLFER